MNETAVNIFSRNSILEGERQRKVSQRNQRNTLFAAKRNAPIPLQNGNRFGPSRVPAQVNCSIVNYVTFQRSRIEL